MSDRKAQRRYEVRWTVYHLVLCAGVWAIFCSTLWALVFGWG